MNILNCWSLHGTTQAGRYRRYLSSNTAKFPIYPDTKRAIYEKYAQRGVPQNFVIDKEGNVLYHVTGYYEAEFMKMVNLINELLK